MKRALLPRTVPVILAILSLAGCRMMEPTTQLRPASAPDISRVLLLNGQTVVFNNEFGWYDFNAALIEGMTVDSQHVTVAVKDINRVETVRAYSVFFLIMTAAVPLALGLYGIWRLVSLLR